MKFLTKIAIALFSVASFAAAQDEVIWDGADGIGRCRTGGSWWSFGDHDNTSSSNFPSPAPKGDAIGAWIKGNGGMIDVTYTLTHSANGYAFYGIGFDFFSPEKDTPQNWTSLCMEYSLTGTAKVELQLKNYSELTHDNDYALVLKNQPTIINTCFTRSEFKQPRPKDTDGTVFPIDELLTKLRGIKFEAVGSAEPNTPLVSRLQLRKITSTTKTTSILAGPSASNLYMVQRQGSLFIEGGSQGSYRIQISNQNGQILSNTTIFKGSLVDSHTLSKGVYLVRIFGQSHNLTKTIVLQ